MSKERIQSFAEQIASHRQPKMQPDIAKQLGERVPVEDAPKPKGKRLGRGVRPDNTVMNGAEKAYSLELERMKAAGEITDWKFHAFKLTIANPPKAKDATWSPDFAVWDADMVLQFHEVKGHFEDHALVRIKCAASQYPHPIIIVKRKTKANGGGWERQEF